jgi:excisionase family DNA binding protein
MTPARPTGCDGKSAPLSPDREPERREVPHVHGYTVEQIAEMLHIGRDKVYVLLRTGQLRSIKIGRSRRITDQHLAEFVSSLEEAS